MWFIIVVILTVWMTISCSDINQFHDQYLDSGEYIYTTKPEVVTFPGRNRIGIKMYYPSPNTTRQTLIEWNDGADSRLIDVSPTGQLDSVMVEIDNLDEKSYFIDFYNIDKNGNRSVKIQTTGTAYGDRYESGLNNRLLLDIGIGDGDTLVTTWSRGTKGAVKFELNYLDQEGEAVKRVIDANQEVFRTGNWLPGSTLTYRTHFLPTPLSIDTFYTRYDSLELPVPVVLSLITDKSQWSILETDSEEPAEGNADNPHNGLAEAAIDGNLNTFWHTQWQSAQPDYPHYFILDLGESYRVGAVESFRRRGNGSAQNLVQILVSEDNENWIDKGTFDIDNQTDEGQLIEFEPGQARYIKYNALAGSSVYAMLAEIEVYEAE